MTNSLQFKNGQPGSNNQALQVDQIHEQIACFRLWWCLFVKASVGGPKWAAHEKDGLHSYTLLHSFMCDVQVQIITCHARYACYASTFRDGRVAKGSHDWNNTGILNFAFHSPTAPLRSHGPREKKWETFTALQLHHQQARSFTLSHYLPLSGTWFSSIEYDSCERSTCFAGSS